MSLTRYTLLQSVAHAPRERRAASERPVMHAAAPPGTAKATNPGSRSLQSKIAFRRGLNPEDFHGYRTSRLPQSYRTMNLQTLKSQINSGAIDTVIVACPDLF